MTTTASLQIKPDFYRSHNECRNSARKLVQTNQRYRNFRQTHFTAGDRDQFQFFRDASNGNICSINIPLNNNLFATEPFLIWKNYKDLRADAVVNTFLYIFDKFKKGIFVKIMDNKLRVFLPFSKSNFTNEWGQYIKIDPNKYKGGLNEFLGYISHQGGYRFKSRFVNPDINEWYGNNCIIRYDLDRNFLPTEGDSNVGTIKNMLEELCANRKVPDIEFFINRRDFPILTKDGTEAYNHLWGGTNIPLVSHSYSQYSPILSMSKTKRYADVLMPTWEDWARVQSLSNIWFPRSCRNYSENFDISWEDKKPIAVFRGGSTGCGVTINSNARLKVAYLSVTTKPDDKGLKYLDAGITNWNLRPRKLQNAKYLQTMEINKFPFGLVSKLSLREQSKYKYIINIEGHVAAFRLSMELNTGSVILLVDSPWKLWYQHLLIPMKHYVPIKGDLSNLLDQIKWCRQNDAQCQEIAENAKKFFQTYLQKEGIFDYLQKSLVNLKSAMGIYLYNTITPLDTQLQLEYDSLSYEYPNTNKGILDINTIPKIGRCYGLLQGMHWIINMLVSNGQFMRVAREQDKITANKLGIIRGFLLAEFPLAIKTTRDPQKIKEHKHEAFIGTKVINRIINRIPNFAYIFGLYQEKDTYNVITERIYGQTLKEYLENPKGNRRRRQYNEPSFNYHEFLFIILQLCLAIQVAQNSAGLVHYDLTPWNIIIQRLNTPQTFDYIISNEIVIRVHTKVIPIIIDYGKSHVIYKQRHHGFINMFKVTPGQDILTLLITSLNQIIREQQLPNMDFKNLLYLSNFLTKTRYRREPFRRAQDLRTFLHKAKKYSALINQDKYELEERTPWELYKYIRRIKDYKFDQGDFRINRLSLQRNPSVKGDNYQCIMDRGNSRQIFDYILCNTPDSRAQTYLDIFVRLKQCTLPQPKNLFFLYYVAQSLENNLMWTYSNMMSFINQTGLDSQKYEDAFRNTMRFIKKLYGTRIHNTIESNVDYQIKGSFKNLIPPPYTQESFLIPSEINSMLTSVEDTDLGDYKEIIQLILLNRGIYELKDKHRRHYLRNFSQLLNTNSLNMHNNSAQNKTLIVLASNIYTMDQESLVKKLKNKGNCSDAEKYMHSYEKIISNLKSLKIPD